MVDTNTVAGVKCGLSAAGEVSTVVFQNILDSSTNSSENYKPMKSWSLFVSLSR